MAAQLSGEDVHLNTGKSEFLLYNASDELVLQDGGDLNSQSCVDHSILAIFEDSGVCSESKNNMEEDSETLLSALAEMLDRVEEDGDETFSPFDVLPNTGLISQTLIRGEDVSQEPSPSQRHRPKPKSKTGRKKENKVLPKALEATVEVFTSTSLISLVNLMHPYCLKLQVEKDIPGSRPSLFSREEVWKYEQPTEENDEEIHVVSEDEAPVKRTEEGVKGEKSSCLKGVLLNGNPPRAVSSRDRKRVSFGPVHVASLDESEEEGLGGGSGRGTGPEPLQSTKAAETPEALQLSSLVSERNDGQINNQQDGGKRSRTRAKSLSLQEYRKLRQSRRPLVEQRGDHTTRWPSITESPRELTPILCFQGQNQNFTDPNLHQPSVHCDCPPHRPSPISSHQSHTRLKSSRTESKIISPTSPLLEDTTTPNVTVLEAISTDPPNPVLLPLPVPRTPPNPPPQSRSGTGLQPRSRRRRGQNAQTPGAPSEPKPHLSSPDEDLGLDDAALPQEVKATKTPPDGSSASPPQTPNCNRNSESSLRGTNRDELPPNSPVQSRTGPAPPPVELKEEAQQERSSPQTDPREPRVAVASGIEAPDPTGLLEQFEETQAKEHEAPRVESGLGTASSPSNQQTDVLVEPNKPGGPERTSRSPLKCPAAPSDSRTLLDVRTLEPVDIPDPVRTEVVQSSQRDEPTRRNGPPSKSVQVIEPRPLPSKRIHTGPAEAPAPRTFSHLIFDHDYCGSADLPPGSRCSQTSEPSTEQQQESVVLLHSEKPWVGPEALQLSEGAVTEGVGVDNIQFLPTPPPSPPVRGREKRRYRRRSPDSSSSSSCSSCGCCSPKRRRIHRRHSGSSSCLSSPSSRVSRSAPPLCSLSFSRSTYSRSRSRSWSRSPSQTRSPSPASRRRRWREVRSSSRESRRLQREQEVRIQKLKAIDERRVVYVGRIRRTMTHSELQERFSQFGEVECVSLHFRDRGDHYAFVTFYNMKDAFAAIDNGGKLRKPDELPFDICFGGRRQFCSSNYADLDANRDAEPSPPCRSRFEDLDFDLLLKQAQRGLKR
nr:peroxisome proliferator-activated receptor gamma coactivator-related protein 1 [Nothobranchius furzeri]